MQRLNLLYKLRPLYLQGLLNRSGLHFQNVTRRQVSLILLRPQTASVLRLAQQLFKPRSPIFITSAVGIAGVGLVLVSNNYSETEIFLKSVKNGNFSKVQAALNSGTDPNARHLLGWGALHVAAVNGHREIVELLLKSGADPNLPDEYTNIYHTARDKGMHSLDVMVTREDEFNSGLNQRANFRGCTPLHYAVLADDPAIVSLLLEGGADPLRANNYGRTPVSSVLKLFF